MLHRCSIGQLNGIPGIFATLEAFCLIQDQLGVGKNAPQMFLWPIEWDPRHIFNFRSILPYPGPTVGKNAPQVLPWPIEWNPRHLCHFRSILPYPGPTSSWQKCSTDAPLANSMESQASLLLQKHFCLV